MKSLPFEPATRGGQLAATRHFLRETPRRLRPLELLLTDRTHCHLLSPLIPQNVTTMSAAPTIIYTKTDEAPALATYSLLPIVQAFTKHSGRSEEPRLNSSHT